MDLSKEVMIALILLRLRSEKLEKSPEKLEKSSRGVRLHLVRRQMEREDSEERSSYVTRVKPTMELDPLAEIKGLKKTVEQLRLKLPAVNATNESAQGTVKSLTEEVSELKAEARVQETEANGRKQKMSEMRLKYKLGIHQPRRPNRNQTLKADI